MYCKNCGSNIDDKAVICPHCGTATDNFYSYKQPTQQVQPVQQYQPVQTVGQPTNVLAIVGFVLSFFVAVAGLVCSILGYRKAPQLMGSGKNLALAGIIISAVSMAIGFIVALIFIIEAATYTDPYYYYYY